MRFKSIDILRALTMLLMIFVNDLWTLTDVPEWLGHKGAREDGLGLAEVVFPAFLFIVGLSVPHAVRARIKKGDSTLQILWHITERTMALLIMGLFMVNLENIDRSQLLIAKPYWQFLMTLGFFLIWNHYRGKVFGVIPKDVLRVTGMAILIFLAVIYTGQGRDGSPQWMRIHWWGILGLIGWGYLLCVLVYLVLRDRPIWIVLACLLLYLLNINEFVTIFGVKFKLVVGASNHASVMSGVMVTVILIWLNEKNRLKYLIPILLGISAILFLFGFLTRPEWGISKIRATPSWTAICAGISIGAFILLHIIADRMKLTRWADIIAPAGTSTLTCYLVPYYVYAIFAITGIHLTGFIVTGMVGILKTFIFSLLIIWLTGLLARLNIKLKI
jgi:heparan-alpha-glucosaminide N-acetyltransferase